MYDQKVFPPAGANWGIFLPGGAIQASGLITHFYWARRTREGEFGPGGPQADDSGGKGEGGKGTAEVQRGASRRQTGHPPLKSPIRKARLSIRRPIVGSGRRAAEGLSLHMGGDFMCGYFPFPPGARRPGSGYPGETRRNAPPSKHKQNLSLQRCIDASLRCKPNSARWGNDAFFLRQQDSPRDGRGGRRGPRSGEGRALKQETWPQV